MYMDNHYRIESINGQDISQIFQPQYNFNTEMSCCFLQFVGVGSWYIDNPFMYWNTDVDSWPFISALICCVLEMIYQIICDE